MVAIASFQVILFGLVLLRFQNLVSTPLVALIKQAETNRLNSAFGPKSKLMEVDRIRYLLENRLLISQKMEEQIGDLEANIQDLEQRLAAATRERDTGRAELTDKSKQIEELRLERVELREVKSRLESNLEEARKSKVDVEVEKRSDEIYCQMEKAVEATAYKAIWFPQIFQDLKAPASIIRSTVKNLEENWDSSSFARLKSDLAILSEQSDLLREQLGNLSYESEDTEEPSSEEAPAPEGVAPFRTLDVEGSEEDSGEQNRATS